MADPVSIAGIILAIPPIAHLLLSYYTDAKEAKVDIQRYIGELMSLKGILEYIESAYFGNSRGSVLKYDSSEFSRLLGMAEITLHQVQILLEPKASATGRLLRQVTWGTKKKDIKGHFDKLERVKSGFLMVMMGDSLSQNHEIITEIKNLREEVRNDRESRESQTLGEDKEILFKWLAPVDPDTIHQSAVRALQPRTGLWFLDGSLRALRESPPGASMVVWLHGKSGSGKTTLFAHTLETIRAECQNMPFTGIAYFYCSFNTLASQDPANIISSILVQLCNASPTLYETLSARFLDLAKKRATPSLNIEEMLEIFREHTRALERVYLFLDAINECNEVDVVFNVLLAMANSSTNIRLLITSTAPINTEIPIRNFTILQEYMSTEEVDKDIATFVNDRIASSKNLCRLSTSLKNEVQKAILSHSGGVFRYAESQIARVSKQLTGRDVRNALDSMPQDLNEVYHRILSNVAPGTRQHTYLRRALLWLCYATRPLQLRELCEAIVIEEDDVDLDSDTRLHDPEQIVTLGQGLLDYNRETGLITLGHSSVKSFLSSAYIEKSDVSHFMINEREAHNTIMCTCLQYLCFTPFHIGCPTFKSQVVNALFEYPLLEYAAHNWPLHIRNETEMEWEHICRFFSTKWRHNRCGSYGFWVSFLATGLEPDIILRSPFLYYAASFGFTSLVKAIILRQGDVDLEQPGGRYGSTALQVACFRRQKDASWILAEAGANAFSIGSADDVDAFWWAMKNGWDDVAQVMMRVGTEKGFKVRMNPVEYRWEKAARRVQAAALDQMQGSAMSRWLSK